MKSLRFVGVALITFAYTAAANSLPLEGAHFYPKVPVIWAATNALPESMMVWRTTHISQPILSNAMALCSFKLFNRVPQKDNNVLLFQDDGRSMAHFLKISPADGSINYHDGRGEGALPHGIPSTNEVEKLALTCLSRLGANTNQVAVAHKSRMEGTMTSFDKRGGHATNSVVYTRGIILYRELDGAPVADSSFWINFGNDGTPRDFHLKWPPLEPFKRFRLFNRDEVINQIKAGNAVVVPNVSDDEPIPAEPKMLTVTRASPRYVMDKRGQFAYPYVELELMATSQRTNKVIFLDCPIIAEGDGIQ